ncbi:MAG: hypothetical protein WA991_03845 [Ornithinimicrobium sp.]
MTRQPTWFDLGNRERRREKEKRYRQRYSPTEQRRDKGIELVHRNASTPWKEAARKQLQQVIETRTTFTSDNILIPLEQQGVVTGDTRALAAILIGARKAGQIEATDNFIPTKRPSRHRAPLRVWRVVKVGAS